MANIKSAKKRILQDAKKTLRNKMMKSATRTAIKKYHRLVILNSGRQDAKGSSAPALSEKKEEAQQLLKIAVTLVDKSASKGVYHRNKSARIKARLHKHFVKNFEPTSSAPATTSAPEEETTTSADVSTTVETTDAVEGNTEA